MNMEDAKLSSRLVAKMVTRGHRASRTMHRLLSPAVQERLELRARDGVSSSDQQVSYLNHKTAPIQHKTQRLSNQANPHRQHVQSEANNASQIDIMQWLIDTSPKKNPWSVTRAVDEVLAVWFGSVPQLAIVGQGSLLRNDSILNDVS